MVTEPIELDPDEIKPAESMRNDAVLTSAKTKRSDSDSC